MGLILNTRPTFYHERFHEAFGDLDWPIYDIPLTLPEPVPGDIPPAGKFDVLIFTSQLGVSAFPNDPQWLPKKVLTVGPGTTDAAKAAGYTDVLQTGLEVEDMRRYLTHTPFGRALYPSGDEVTADLAEEFAGRVERVVVYRMIPRMGVPPQLLAEIKKGTPIAATVFSHRGAVILADLLAKAGITAENAHIALVGISANAVIPGPWQKQFVAAQPVQDDLVVRTGEAITSFG
jgi:uroporphyrinogen-III synthase